MRDSSALQIPENMLELCTRASEIGSAVNPVAVAGELAGALRFLSRTGLGSAELMRHPAVVVMLDALVSLSGSAWYPEESDPVTAYGELVNILSNAVTASAEYDHDLTAAWLGSARRQGRKTTPIE